MTLHHRTAIRRIRRHWLTLAGILALAACGGGGGGGGGNGGDGRDSGGSKPSPAQTLSGTAAAGAPIIGSVFVKDSAGTVRSVAIDANGGYSIDVTGLTPPFVMRAQGTAGGRSYTVHSAAIAADIGGTINITPLTDLIVANVARQVAAKYFDSGVFSGLTATELNAAENTLQQRLQAVLTELGVADSIDLLRSAFSANHTGLDGALDILRVSVDPATHSALITHVINNAAITDDLTLSADSSLLDSTGTVSGLSAWDAIRARFASFEAAFATGLPAADDPLLLAQFDQAGFVIDGDDLATFLGDITSDPGNVGLRFTSLSLVSLTPASATQNGRAVVTFGLAGNRRYPSLDFVVTGIYDNATGGTNWLLAGNQRIASVYAEPRSLLGFDISDRARIQSGIGFAIGSDSSIHDYAVVTGPGLPESGGGASGASTGLLLVKKWVSGGDFTVASSPYVGAATPVHPRAAANQGEVYTWTDAEIAALPADNLTYSVTFYDDKGTPTITDDSAIATYPFTLLKPPLPASSLSMADFPVITAPTPAEVLSIYNTGGPLTVTWNLPAGLEADELDARGGYESVDSEELLPTATSTTLQFMASTGMVTSGFLTMIAADAYGRNYSYRLYVP